MWRISKKSYNRSKGWLSWRTQKSFHYLGSHNCGQVWSLIIHFYDGYFFLTKGAGVKMSLSVRTKFPNNQSMRGILPPDHVGTLFESPEKAIETKVASFLSKSQVDFLSN